MMIVNVKIDYFSRILKEVNRFMRNNMEGCLASKTIDELSYILQ